MQFLPSAQEFALHSRKQGFRTGMCTQCSNRGAINNVASGRKHDRVYDMNRKLALGKTVFVFLVHWCIIS